MKEQPLVLCLTNTVAANFTANCLIAIGAKPAMIEEPSEAAELASVADAVLVNLGTVTELQAKAMRAAVRVANERGIPWVLDPVGVQLLSYRRELARELIALEPSLLRCNQAEAAALGETGCVTLVTGEVDRVGKREVRGGVPMLQAVTATGCAALVKGGHAVGDLVSAEDTLFDGKDFFAFALPWVEDPVSTHGTGCSLAAALAAELTPARPLPTAVKGAKAYVHAAIENSFLVGTDCGVLGFAD